MYNAVIRLMVVVAISATSFTASAALSARSYITKGLIAHWDGIENVSYGGAHDDDASTWMELTGNGPNITKPTGSTFVNAGLQTVRASGTQISVANAKKILAAFAAANYTAEVAFNQTQATANSSAGYKNMICTMLMFGDSKYWLGTHSNNTIGMNPNNAGHVGYLNNTYKSLFVTVPSTMNQHSFSCSQFDTSCVIRADGELSGTRTVTTLSSPSTAHGFCFNRSYFTDHGLNGVYHAIRIYDRALTVDEVAVNYAVDSVRYFGADAAQQSLPDGWRFDTTDGVKLEKRLSVFVKNSVGGTIVLNGGKADIADTIWCEQGGSVAVTLVARPEEGYTFVGWAGLDDTVKYNDSISVSIADDVYAVFRKTDGSQPCAYSWKGTVDTDWNAAENWSDEDGFAGMPAMGDSVTIPAGKTAMMTNSSPNFASVTVAGTLVMTNWTTCLNASTVTIANGGVLTCGAATTNKIDMSRVWVNCAGLTIAEGGKIDVNGKGYLGLPTSSDYKNGFGPGKAKYVFYRGTSHGGYGSQKVVADYATNGNNALPYDDPAAPVEPGSSGVANKWAGGGNGGGCVLVTASGNVVVNGSILASGESTSASGNTTNHDTAGSGGSIYITCSTIAGSGTIRADGGSGDDPSRVNPGMVAGGGCIAIHYDTAIQTATAVAGMTISADAGHWRGSNNRTTCVNADNNRVEADIGTLHFSDAKILDALLGCGLTGQIRGIAFYSRDGDLEFMSGHVRFAEEGVNVSILGNMTLGGTASRFEIGGSFATNVTRFVDLRSFGASPRLTVGGDLTLEGVSRLDVRAAATNDTDVYGAYVTIGGAMNVGTNCFVYAWSDSDTPSAPHFNVGSLNVATGGTISASWRGGRSSISSHGTGNGAAMYCAGGRVTANGGGRETSGAGHGGRGALGTNKSSTGGRIYDDAYRPQLPGSGAGAWNEYNQGGYGGGAILVSALNGTIRVDGTVIADGCDGDRFCNGNGGGGSGGTIFFESRYFAAGETAVFSARGGNTKPLDEANSMGAGGGGSIAIWCGEPYEDGLPRTRLSKGETPLVSEGDEEFFSFSGSYSVAGGVPVGNFAQSWSDGASGGVGTVWFVRVKKRAGLNIIVR